MVSCSLPLPVPVRPVDSTMATVTLSNSPIVDLELLPMLYRLPLSQPPTQQELVDAVTQDDRHLLRIAVLHSDVFLDVTTILRAAVTLGNREIIVMVLKLTETLWQDEPMLWRYFVDETLKEISTQGKVDLLGAVHPYRNRLTNAKTKR